MAMNINIQSDACWNRDFINILENCICCTTTLTVIDFFEINTSNETPREIANGVKLRVCLIDM